MKTKVRTKASAFIATLEDAWDRIRENHPELPQEVIFTLGEGKNKWAHWEAESWELNKTVHHELFLSGEGLTDGAEQLLNSILHEGAHALATVRGIMDTGASGAYHKKIYKNLAYEMGLRAEKNNDAKYMGYGTTYFLDSTLGLYAGLLSDLEEALNLYRPVPVEPVEARKSPEAECGCGRLLRVSKKLMKQGSIICGLCNVDFELVEEV